MESYIIGSYRGYGPHIYTLESFSNEVLQHNRGIKRGCSLSGGAFNPLFTSVQQAPAFLSSFGLLR